MDLGMLRVVWCGVGGIERVEHKTVPCAAIIAEFIPISCGLTSPLEVNAALNVYYN